MAQSFPQNDQPLSPKTSGRLLMAGFAFLFFLVAVMIFVAVFLVYSSQEEGGDVDDTSLAPEHPIFDHLNEEPEPQPRFVVLDGDSSVANVIERVSFAETMQIIDEQVEATYIESQREAWQSAAAATCVRVHPTITDEPYVSLVDLTILTAEQEQVLLEELGGFHDEPETILRTAKEAKQATGALEFCFTEEDVFFVSSSPEFDVMVERFFPSVLDNGDWFRNRIAFKSTVDLVYSFYPSALKDYQFFLRVTEMLGSRGGRIT